MKTRRKGHRKVRRQPFRLLVEYKVNPRLAHLDREGAICRLAGRDPCASGNLFNGSSSIRDLEFSFSVRRSAIRAAERITESCRGVKCEVRGRVWP